MYTKQALHELGIKATAITDEQKRQLDSQGFFIVENALQKGDVKILREEFERIHAAETEKGGHEVHVEPGARRISNIFNKTTAFDVCLNLPPVLAAAHYLLGEIKVHGANLRDPNQGYGHQALHVDVPKRFVDDWWVLNAMLMLDDMTLENGPTRVVPTSQWWAPINPSLPDVAAVVTQGGDGYGAAQAFKAAGRPTPLIIMGNRQDELAWWKEQKDASGYETMSVSIAPGVSTLAFWVAQQILDGKDVPKDMIVPFLRIDQDNLEANLANTEAGGVANVEYSLEDAQKVIAGK